MNEQSRSKEPLASTNSGISGQTDAGVRRARILDFTFSLLISLVFWPLLMRLSDSLIHPVLELLWRIDDWKIVINQKQVVDRFGDHTMEPIAIEIGSIINDLFAASSLAILLYLVYFVVNIYFVKTRASGQ